MHGSGHNILVIDSQRVVQSIGMNNMAAVFAKGTPPADKTHIVRPGKDGYARGFQGCSHMLAG
jgi:hypothetical protein